LYDVHEAVERFAAMANDPLLVTRVLRVLAGRYGPAIQEYVCDRCALSLAERARDDVTWHSKDGHYTLDPDEERYGKFTEGGVTTVVARQRKTAQEAIVETDQNTVNEVQEAPVPPAEPKETRGQRLLRELPPDTLVEFDKTEWIGMQGRVTGIEERRGVAYTQIQVEVYKNGARRVDDKVVLVREGSIHVIAMYRPDPTATDDVTATHDAGLPEPA
jgi:hypothetical protein